MPPVFLKEETGVFAFGGVERRSDLSGVSDRESHFLSRLSANLKRCASGRREIVRVRRSYPRFVRIRAMPDFSTLAFFAVFCPALPPALVPNIFLIVVAG